MKETPGKADKRTYGALKARHWICLENGFSFYYVFDPWVRCPWYVTVALSALQFICDEYFTWGSPETSVRDHPRLFKFWASAPSCPGSRKRFGVLLLAPSVPLLQSRSGDRRSTKAASPEANKYHLEALPQHPTISIWKLQLFFALNLLFPAGASVSSYKLQAGSL